MDLEDHGSLALLAARSKKGNCVYEEACRAVGAPSLVDSSVERAA